MNLRSNMTADDERPISFDGVKRAAARLSGHAIHTPIIENEFLNEIASARVFIKPEVLQHCGSFKFRGAYNRIANLSEAEKSRGIIAWSSGNHAQGIARAAKLFGVKATIVMPEDAPQIKTEKVRALGANIVTYDRYREDREAIALAIAHEQNLALAPSFDHPDIIEGQGTVGLEIAEDLRERDVVLDAIIISCGGGGLTSGCALALEATSPNTAVWIAEPEGFDEAWPSIAGAERHFADVTQATICDAIATPTPGQLTLPIMKRLVRGGFSVSQSQVEEAMAFAYKHLKLVVEPGGAVGLAALLRGAETLGSNIGVVLSGGNVDGALYAEILKRRL